MSKKLLSGLLMSSLVVLLFPQAAFAEVEPTAPTCMSTVVDLDGLFSVELLGGDGARSEDCRFVDYTYEVLSGEAELLSADEYTLVFDGTKIGRVRVTTTSPSSYWAEYEIGKSVMPADFDLSLEKLRTDEEYLRVLYTVAKTGEVIPTGTMEDPEISVRFVIFSDVDGDNAYNSDVDTAVLTKHRSVNVYELNGMGYKKMSQLLTKIELDELAALTGEYKIYVKVDAENELSETDETNNESVSYLSLDAAEWVDLTASDLVMGATTPGSIQFDYTLANSGSYSVPAKIHSKTESGVTAVYIDGIKSTNLLWSADSDTTYLNAESSAAKSFMVNLATLSAGDHTIQICIDSAAAEVGLVSETDETNNCTETVSFSATYNLRIGDLAINTKSLRVSYNVFREGTLMEGTGNVPVEFNVWRDENGNGSYDAGEEKFTNQRKASVSELNTLGVKLMGQLLTKSQLKALLSLDGVFNVTVTVDPDGAYDMGSTADNSATIMVNLSSDQWVDLYVQDLTLVGASADGLVVSYVAGNAGQVNVPKGLDLGVTRYTLTNSAGEVVYTEDYIWELYKDDPAVKFRYLAAGKYSDQSYAINFDALGLDLVPGDYTLTVYIDGNLERDPAGAVFELSEANNSQTVGFSIAE